ncbi:MAG: hypothetical protein HFG29_11045 [Eubacterium sp.]|nr:hypothetical protein [Eubacterium sp.]
MKEKDIREKLNQELEDMAPDMLSKILGTPIEPVKSEKELFGKERPLFKEKKNWKPYVKVPAIAAVAACFVALIILLYPLFSVSNHVEQKMAFSIVVDVNPSIRIDVNEDGSIHKIKAGNKDAKKIVNYVKSELKDGDDYKQVIKLVVKNLKSEGYLKKKKNAMLVSAIPIEENDITKEIKEVKKETSAALKNRDIKCKTVYQKVEVNDRIKRVASNNDVSLGKAALCIELAKEEKVSVKRMCKKNIANLIQKVEKSNNTILNSIVVIDDNEEYTSDAIESFGETESLETQTVEIPTETYESESISETIENPAESTVGFEETSTENQTNEI